MIIDTITEMTEFGLDTNGVAFTITVCKWEDGMYTTSAKGAETLDPEFDELLTTATEPTIRQIREQIEYEFQARWERNQERLQSQG